MSDGSDQPKPSAQSANPFANPLSSPSGQASNPFGASQLVAPSTPQVGGSANPFASPVAPGASANPFAAPAAPAAPAGPAASVNPFAAPAAPAGPAASVNPFAAPAPAGGGSVNPFASPAEPAPAGGGSVNPFASPAEPAPAGGGSVNPFAAPAELASALTDDASSPALALEAKEPEQSSTEDGPSHDQLQQLNPFRMAAAPEPSADELQALAGDFKLSLVPKKTVITYAAGAAAAALVIGLLIGGLASGRSDHSKRVVAWKQIDRELKKPLEQLKTLEASVNAIIEGTQKQQLKWDQVEAIPTRFANVDFSLLAPGVSMSQVAMIKLSALLIKMQNTFTKASVYRATTLKDKGSITQILDKKDFAALPVHAIHVENYLDSCIKRGRPSCTNFDSLKRGSGRVVGLMSAKITRGKLNVITRDGQEPFDVDISDLVLVPRADIVGSGVNPMIIHNQNLNELKAELDSLVKTRNDFERILQEKRTLE